jgi:hypothetical protein
MDRSGSPAASSLALDPGTDGAGIMDGAATAIVAVTATVEEATGTVVADTRDAKPTVAEFAAMRVEHAATLAVEHAALLAADTPMPAEVPVVDLAAAAMQAVSVAAATWAGAVVMVAADTVKTGPLRC